MKKYILMLAVASAAALVACGGNKEAEATEPVEEVEAVEVVENTDSTCCDSAAACCDSAAACCDSTATK